MGNLEKYDEVTACVKNTILKYCPYIDDRFKLFDDHNLPNFDIKIRNYVSDSSSRSLIYFMHGNENHKERVSDFFTFDSYLDFDKLKETIDFILSDHAAIGGFAINDNQVSLFFCINWTAESTKGLSCGAISLTVEFDNVESLKSYLSSVVNNYYDHLEKCSAFKRYESMYITMIKKDLFGKCSREKLMDFLTHLSDQELVDLLMRIDDDIFVRIFTKDNGDDNNKQKPLSMKKDL